MTIGISLGFNCDSAVYAVNNKLRSRKNEGYNTCPFDEMVSNYKGIIACINDGFKYFCDPEYLELKKMQDDSWWKNEIFIYNKKYNFIFNHESPGHANLYITQNWKNGINHFCMNNFKEFIIRYRTRIQNFINYLTSNNEITFVITRKNCKLENLSELQNIIKSKYPKLNFSFVILNTKIPNLIEWYTILMEIDENDDEVMRLL